MEVLLWNLRKLFLAAAFMLFAYQCTVLVYVKYNSLFSLRMIYPKPRPAIQKPYSFSNLSCPSSISKNNITPIKGTRYIMVSAFLKESANRKVRIIGIMNGTSYEPFTCIFCCNKHGLSTSPALLDRHVQDFGFPYVTTDVFCTMESTCNATHVTISKPEYLLDIQSHLYLPILKSLPAGQKFDVDFTLCLSCLFGGYNNVLQFVQTVEMYRLLGVEKIFIYNTSCGPDLEKVLQVYKDEDVLEIVPWPIDHFLVPSKGWSFELHPGEVLYYGQQATLNDCVCRNRERSRYVLLNDADEIIMPYQHSSLQELMRNLEEQYPQTGTFIFQTHVFPKGVTSDSSTFDLPQWRNIPGINILRNTYREPIQWFVNNPSKMIVNPREVLQTSVHTVVKSTSRIVNVPKDLAIVMHTAKPKQPKLGIEKLIRDKKIWQYAKRLIPNVNRVLQKAGLLN